MLLIGIIQLVSSTMMLDEEVTLELTVPQVSGHEFVSSMNINGIQYMSICECVSPELTEQEDIKCAPSIITLTQDIEAPGATLEEVQEKLETGNYTFVNVYSSSFRCIDGRITEPSLGSFGGDLGEFALALLVYEDLSGSRLDEETIRLYLTEYLECMEQESFYWCNDDDAVGKVEKEMGIEGIDFYNPRQDLEEQLLELLMHPDGIGDLHIKNMLKYPDKYSIRKEAVELLVKVFYKILWNEEDSMREELYFEIYPGSHNETGFLEVRTMEDCFVLEAAPLVVPREGDKDNLSLFVHHLDAVNIKRTQLSLFFGEKIAKNQDGITADKFLSRMKHHGIMFMDVTGSIIAGNIPFFTANFEN
ncbi:hypothetical protein SteCoe_16785 [Stentor coeruleus]|uniref:Uncharacterized protein n=1 Tax=Stentor coeruleus TaxID=5963 RepID=A0A1R2C0F1_9CILI|nr:hypothetical protein SteCoe_16785 [Stentor coeruleus]